MQYDPAERLILRLGTKSTERALFSLREDPPSRLPLISVLANEYAETAVEHEADHTAARLRRLRRFLEVHPTCLREVDQQPTAAF
jgi:hypothetical protein